MSASIAVWTPNKGVQTVRKAEPTRCASVLKPAYALVCEHPQWDTLAERSITRSDNDATNELTGRNVERLVDALATKTDVVLEPAETWGRLLVNATDLASIYAALMADECDKTSQVRNFMRGVVPAQRFGFRDPMKAGWDMYDSEDGKHHIVTNIVIFTHGGLVTAVSDKIVGYDTFQLWHMTLRNGPEAVIPIHSRLTRPNIRELVGFGIARLALP